jgi:adenylate kinase family enzyme
VPSPLDLRKGVGHRRDEARDARRAAGHADTVIHLDLPTRECLSGILRRRLRYRGRLRPDLGVYDRINFEFLRWVWSFRRRHRPVLLELLATFDGERIVLRRRRDVRRFLDSVTAWEKPAIAA